MSATAAAQTLPHRPDTERLAMTAQTTAHSPARINPDTLPVLIAAIVVGLLVPASASFTLSFDGLSAVAPWAAVRPERAWLIPVSIDAAQIGFTLAAFIHLARGESARWAWTWVTLWTLVSASANAGHAWSSGPGGWEGIAGACLAAFFPIGTLVTSHTAARIMIGRLSVVAASAVAATVVVEQPAPVAETSVAADVRDIAPVAGARTPDPLVVLEEIEQAGPETSVATVVAGRDVADRDERRDVATEDRPVTAPRRASWGTADEDRVAELARTTHLSGTKIAEQLGTNKNRTCALVVATRKAGERFELVQETYPA